uniref:B-cell lymphoma/leukemia 10 n=1 Tax=Aotus nancymaae TaxID=37293 RepID=A0A2K5E7J7_AOTNA
MEPTAPSLTEEDLTEVKKDALENLRVYLCEKIIAERHFDHLRAKKILSREDTEEISCRTSSRKRAGKLLDYLQENPKGLDTLVESIRREKTQNFLIQKITDEVLKLRNLKLEHLKDGATNNLSRSNSDESNFSEKLRASTVMYHPEGESNVSSLKITYCFTTMTFYFLLVFNNDKKCFKEYESSCNTAVMICLHLIHVF